MLLQSHSVHTSIESYVNHLLWWKESKSQSEKNALCEQAFSPDREKGHVNTLIITACIPKEGGMYCFDRWYPQSGLMGILLAFKQEDCLVQCVFYPKGDAYQWVIFHDFTHTFVNKCSKQCESPEYSGMKNLHSFLSQFKHDNWCFFSL